MNCTTCSKELIKPLFVQKYKCVDFSGIKPYWNDWLHLYFCSKPCKSAYNVKREESLQDIAELDESLNWCPFFIRVEGNNGSYVREWKTYPKNVSWLWDYKSTPKEFEEWIQSNGWLSVY